MEDEILDRLDAECDSAAIEYQAVCKAKREFMKAESAKAEAEAERLFGNSLQTLKDEAKRRQNAVDKYLQERHERLTGKKLNAS